MQITCLTHYFEIRHCDFLKTFFSHVGFPLLVSLFFQSAPITDCFKFVLIEIYIVLLDFNWRNDVNFIFHEWKYKILTTLSILEKQLKKSCVTFSSYRVTSYQRMNVLFLWMCISGKVIHRIRKVHTFKSQRSRVVDHLDSCLGSTYFYSNCGSNYVLGE